MTLLLILMAIGNRQFFMYNIHYNSFYFFCIFLCTQRLSELDRQTSIGLVMSIKRAPICVQPRFSSSFTSEVVLTRRALWVAVVKTSQLNELKYKHHYLLSNSLKPGKLNEMRNLNENVFNLSPTQAL